MSKVLRKIIYVVCFPLIMVFGLITLPLSLFCNWKVFWIITIMHEEFCSYKEAKRLLAEGKKYKITSSSNRSSNVNFTSSSEYDERFSPMYKHLPSNINHRLD